MQEKEFTMNDATSLWWFIGWRTGLTLVAINLIVAMLPRLIQMGTVAMETIEWVAIIVSLVFAIYYIKIAVNRNHKEFRLSATSRS